MPKQSKSTELEIDGIIFNITQKKIRNLHLKIKPPHGEALVSAPMRFSLTQITRFILSKIEWVKKSQISIINKKIIPNPKFKDGEKHLLFGKEFDLKIIEKSSKKAALIQGNIIEIHLKKTSTIQERSALLDKLYRQELQKAIPDFIEKYEEKMNLSINECRIKKMKTRWGTCNLKDKRIWIALELAKKPMECLEMIIVHEMTHLFERKHNKRFYKLMDDFLPNWRLFDKQLKEK